MPTLVHSSWSMSTHMELCGWTEPSLWFKLSKRILSLCYIFSPKSPLFVGNDYFCESGHTTSSFSGFPVLFPNDPLWDGEGCVSSTCCELNNPPWFTKTLPSTTSDDIELRICLHDVISNENTPIEHLIELY